MKKFFVCFLAVALVFAFTAPVMAAGDWSFYGNTRFQTFSVDRDKEAVGAAATEGDTDTAWFMQGNSRLGGKVAAGDVSGHFEFAVTGQTGGTNVGTRHLTGSWNFGAGTLLVGHTWSVITNLLSNQAANAGQGLLGYGSVFQSRSDQIRLTFGGLKLGFLGPRVPATFVNDVDTTLPKIEVAYRFATDMFWIEPFLGYQSFDYAYAATSATTDVTSMVYGLKGKVNVGPAYIGFGLSAGTNPTEYGLSGTGQAVTLVGTEYKDVDYMEYMLNVGFKMSDMVTFEGGYGAQMTESDPGTGVKTEMDNFSYYIQADISLAPGVHLIPEYAKIDNGETKTGAATPTDNGGTTYIGAKWQINF